MSIHELAGKQAPAEILTNIPKLVAAYYTYKPDPGQTEQKVSFGTSGHRGTSLNYTFNEMHILAITQAIVEYRKSKNFSGPLFLGIDTHALSEPAFMTVVEVLAANEIETMIHANNEYTPTPVISHAILTYNNHRKDGFADGIVITPSHNPPNDGGIKYNPPTGGPADSATTKIIEDRANEILAARLKGVQRIPFDRALKSGSVFPYDFLTPYVHDLNTIIDFEPIIASGMKIGVDPLGGSGVHFWDPIAALYGLDITVVNDRIDPAFSFMSVDKDGKVRMDCSSPYAMAGLIALKNDFDIAFGNDPDYDRHGIVTRQAGLLNPNHYLSVAVQYLFQNRPEWPAETIVGKTLVSSSMIDRVAAALGKKLHEVPVGFKYFVPGLLSGKLGFGGEESAGAAFLRLNGGVWTTDKDGIIMDLLAAEITAKSGKDPSELYRELTDQFGSPVYERSDAPASRAQKNILKNLSAGDIKSRKLAGEKIIAKMTHAPGNNQPIGGLKIVTENGWFAARPSGTEEIYKIYAESFLGEDHLKKIQVEAQDIVKKAFKNAGA